MITSRAIRQFFERPRKDYRGWKDYSDAKLEKLCIRLPVHPPIWSKLQRPQKVCFQIGAREKRFAFHLDTGMGKTLLAASLHRYFWKLGSVKRSLVLVPNRVNKYEWVDEVSRHTKMTIQVLAGSSQAKWDQLLNSDTDLVVDTYAGFVRMVTKVVASKKRPGKGKLKLVPSLVKKLCAQFQGLIMDEATLAKSKKTLPFRVCRQLSKTCEIVFLLTGTPFGKDPTDVWSQFFLIDHGHTFGETLGLFRAAFFIEKEAFWSTEYTFDKKKDALFNELLANKSIRFAADPKTMPKVMSIVKTVRLPSNAQSYYNAAREKLERAHGSYEEMQNTFIRMRQISSGFIGYTNDEEGTKAKFEFEQNPKLDMLMATIETIPSTSKFIVYHDYVFSGAMIARELNYMKVKFVRVFGGTRDPEAALHAFKTDPKVRGLLLNNAAGGFGLNLQIAQYGFRYEPPLSTIMEVQTKRRFIRQHSPHKHVFLYDFVVQGTKDQEILDAHAEGRSLFESLIEGRRTSRRVGGS